MTLASFESMGLNHGSGKIKILTGGEQTTKNVKRKLQTMKSMYRTVGIAVLSMGLVLTTGCMNPNGTQNNTGTGALVGGLAGAFAGGLSWRTSSRAERIDCWLSWCTCGRVDREYD